jgi:hypothetical protein
MASRCLADREFQERHQFMGDPSGLGRHSENRMVYAPSRSPGDAIPFVGSLSREIEVDETFIGGKARYMHADKRRVRIKGRGPDGKTVVAAVLDRHGDVRATVLPTRRKADLQKLVRDNVAPGSELFSDALKSYDGLDGEFVHQVIDHAEAYAKGNVHTN